jgi:hypothetical protein
VSTTFFFFSSSSFFLSTLRNKQPWHWVNDFTFPLRLNPFLHFSICLFCLFVFSFFSLLIFLCFVCLSSYLFSMSWSIFLRTSVALVLIQTCHKTKISILLKTKNEKKKQRNQLSQCFSNYSFTFTKEKDSCVKNKLSLFEILVLELYCNVL